MDARYKNIYGLPDTCPVFKATRGKAALALGVWSRCCCQRRELSSCSYSRMSSRDPSSKKPRQMDAGKHAKALRLLQLLRQVLPLDQQGHALMMGQTWLLPTADQLSQMQEHNLDRDIRKVSDELARMQKEKPAMSDRE
jgi:hypothetical protein